jgi:hypothetical protein
MCQAYKSTTTRCNILRLPLTTRTHATSAILQAPTTSYSASQTLHTHLKPLLHAPGKSSLEQITPERQPLGSYCPLPHPGHTPLCPLYHRKPRCTASSAPSYTAQRPAMHCTAAPGALHCTLCSVLPQLYTAAAGKGLQCVQQPWQRLRDAPSDLKVQQQATILEALLNRVSLCMVDLQAAV